MGEDVAFQGAIVAMRIETAHQSSWKSRPRRVGILALLVVAVPAIAAADGDWPSKVTANYKITFNGFDVGDFRFESNLGSRGYSLDGRAKLSALLGIFEWKGSTNSTGVLARGEPKPADYSFKYRSSSKSGSVAMSFSKDRVTDRTVVPPSSPSKKTVPLTEEHLKGVLDPMSAVMAMTRQRENPCDQKIAIFDGKQRFDLELSYRRQQTIKEARPSGEPSVAFVCNVRYIPIAGHKDSRTIRKMAETDGIEVVLRPIPSANIFIPYQVTIPTIAGSAVVRSQRVEITTGMRQIALVH